MIFYYYSTNQKKKNILLEEVFEKIDNYPENEEFQGVYNKRLFVQWFKVEDETFYVEKVISGEEQYHQEVSIETLKKIVEDFFSGGNLEIGVWIRNE